jgi:hypothetical protein
MIFRVYEHYDDDQPIYGNFLIDNKECFICFEFKTPNEIKTSNLKNQKMYVKNCFCDGSLHIECLKTWFNIHKSCPICRKSMIEVNLMSFVLCKFIPFGTFIYIKVKTISKRIIKIITFLIFIYTLFDFYLKLFNTKSKIYENYTYDNNIDYSYGSNIILDN